MLAVLVSLMEAQQCLLQAGGARVQATVESFSHALAKAAGLAPIDIDLVARSARVLDPFACTLQVSGAGATSSPHGGRESARQRPSAVAGKRDRGGAPINGSQAPSRTSVSAQVQHTVAFYTFELAKLKENQCALHCRLSQILGSLIRFHIHALFDNCPDSACEVLGMLPDSRCVGFLARRNNNSLGAIVCNALFLLHQHSHLFQHAEVTHHVRSRNRRHMRSLSAEAQDELLTLSEAHAVLLYIFGTPVFEDFTQQHPKNWRALQQHLETARHCSCVDEAFYLPLLDTEELVDALSQTQSYCLVVQQLLVWTQGTTPQHERVTRGHQRDRRINYVEPEDIPLETKTRKTKESASLDTKGSYLVKIKLRGADVGDINDGDDDPDPAPHPQQELQEESLALHTSES